MSKYEQKPNTGVLFKNNRKEKESHPNTNGTCLIDGKTYRISGWTKEKNGEKYQSLAFTPVEAPKESTPASIPAPAPTPKTDDDDLPF
jgi:hypothetical protein